MCTVKKSLTALYFFSRKPQYLSVFWNETNKLCHSACSTDEPRNTESTSLLSVPWSRALVGSIPSTLLFDGVGNRSIQRESRRLSKNLQTTHRKDWGRDPNSWPSCWGNSSNQVFYKHQTWALEYTGGKRHCWQARHFIHFIQLQVKWGFREAVCLNIW